MASDDLIADESALAATCAVLAANERLAVDTDFLRERTYETQLAAVLLGMPPPIGYAARVTRVLGVELAKSQGANLARTDLTRRPSSAAQLDYARDDERDGTSGKRRRSMATMP